MMQTLINICSLSAFYMCFALGLALVFGIMRIINFAHGEIYAMGAYTAFITNASLGPTLGAPKAWVLSFAAAAILAALLGGAIHFLIVRRLDGRPLSIFIATLALSYILQVAILGVFGPVGLNLAPPVRGVVTIEGAIIPWSRVLVIAGALGLALALWTFLMRSDAGRVVRAVAQNPRGAVLQGVEVSRVGLLTLMLGSAIAGVSGALMAPVVSISPYMGATALWKAFVIIIVGGIGSVWGAAAAAILFGTLDTLMSSLGAGQYLALTNAAIMLVVLSVRPHGLFGEKE
jgi:branched-subunit amino acid ABC-type transport system permease component